MRTYIFGYGSLFSTESRAQTAATPYAFPATLRGYKRGWYFHDRAYTCTALGIVRSPRHSCNGVLVAVHDDQVPYFDAREEGYVRVDVTGNVHTEHPMLVDNDAKVWAYVVGDVREPTHAFPIAQSYLDHTLAGCLEHSVAQAIHFIATTFDWSSHWVNDRAQPTSTPPRK